MSLLTSPPRTLINTKAVLGKITSFVQIAAAVESAGVKTDEQIKTMLQQKAQEVVSKLDLHKALSLDLPPEQIIQDAMQQATAQLQSEGKPVSFTLPDQQMQTGSPVQVERDLSHTYAIVLHSQHVLQLAATHQPYGSMCAASLTPHF